MCCQLSFARSSTGSSGLVNLPTGREDHLSRFLMGNSIDHYRHLEPQVKRCRKWIDDPETDPQDKASIRNDVVRSLDYSLDVGEITAEQRHALMKLLGAFDAII